MRRVRIQDVAQKCGLSITTVSQALNLRPDQCRVSDETRKLVKRVADELGYRASRVARGLAKGRSFAVAILAYSVAPGGIYTEMIAVISQELAARGYHLILAPVDETVDEWAQTLLDEQLDGCLVLNNVSVALRDILANARLPVVLVNVQSDLPVCQVLVNDTAGTRELMAYLRGLGHQRIDYFNGDTSELRLPPGSRHYSLREREGAFLEAMKDLPPDHARVINSTLESYTDHLASTPAEQRPTAVICFWHRMGRRLVRLLWERGIQVPSDISVATFNDVEGIADAIPPMTTVAIPNEEMGRVAVQMLLGLMDDVGGSASPQSLVLSPRLIVRKSTAGPRPGG